MHFQVLVVDGLLETELSNLSVLSRVSSFVGELVLDGELILARALRTTFIQKYEDRRTKMLPDLDFGRLSFHRE